ncbi:hypothetical protein [Caldimonas brevitalea]|uniref:Uncharacterized protein n=1 Tax=Caldimonas brevitalea TaxID=413882 RepID=A0A0G3BK47_9BURK|nr:hypothetical protein [Caldimonas brevitalea]AKJ28353.1 hypothetical protein AAW51_1662 [Caldimonas brevitalea]
MQNPDFLNACLAELEKRYDNVEIVAGDRYHPVWAIKLNSVELPKSIVERTVDIIIPMTRCAGYLPGSGLAGLHVSQTLHSLFEGEKTVVPFCDPVQDISWLVKTSRFYPFYEHDPELLIGTSYLCLNDPFEQPETPQALMELTLDYLKYWMNHAFNLVMRHGAIVRGEELGDRRISMDWIEHLVEQVSPTLKAQLLEEACLP